MKYERTASFKADYRRLSREQRERFRKVAIAEFAPSAERHVESPGERWPKRLRVKDVEGAPGVWEMTWDWPDGRATFEWVALEGKPGIRWRRVGGHDIFREP